MIGEGDTGPGITVFLQRVLVVALKDLRREGSVFQKVERIGRMQQIRLSHIGPNHFRGLSELAKCQALIIFIKNGSYGPHGNLIFRQPTIVNMFLQARGM